VQATRTYLELTDRSAFREAFGSFPALLVRRVEQPTPRLYRLCYRTVGEAYHWRDRWDWSDDQIRAHLAQPGITLYLATEHDRFMGFYELSREDDGAVELAYFGLAPDAIGRGLGRHLLSCAVRDAWASGTSRVWVHTCTLDHPHALANYRSRGFVPYRTEQYEVQ
jgi:GNAT superfamily N-acetyltransferase